MLDNIDNLIRQFKKYHDTTISMHDIACMVPFRKIIYIHTSVFKLTATPSGIYFTYILFILAIFLLLRFEQI